MGAEWGEIMVLDPFIENRSGNALESHVSLVTTVCKYNKMCATRT
ncbi:hypothetical protein MtrunA17_Chr3g0127261 [Medicago truncatula]|uniref:Uncharacterized protein n=1 Tax=Medicago truncatula TaxID=3880 RepID=A0A396IYC8_MEDTR|nr:hypothetical protein MtrunA17_Chr3g0127261 [Medicago truncatula]